MTYIQVRIPIKYCLFKRQFLLIRYNYFNLKFRMAVNYADLQQLNTLNQENFEKRMGQIVKFIANQNISGCQSIEVAVDTLPDRSAGKQQIKQLVVARMATLRIEKQVKKQLLKNISESISFYDRYPYLFLIATFSLITLIVSGVVMNKDSKEITLIYYSNSTTMTLQNYDKVGAVNQIQDKTHTEAFSYQAGLAGISISFILIITTIALFCECECGKCRFKGAIVKKKEQFNNQKEDLIKSIEDY